ncbi:hypothetical protein FPV67DRAFT_1682530 [Lyophyllum atratum]|nr:hypothetical protein FPV67DRAFT_1682530 [Lyophyllum atratum]
MPGTQSHEFREMASIICENPSDQYWFRPNLATVKLEYITGLPSSNEYLTLAWLPTMRRAFYWINNLANKDHEGGLIRKHNFSPGPLSTDTNEEIKISKSAARRIQQLEGEMAEINYQIAAIRIESEIKHLKTHGLPLNTIRVWVGNDAGPEILARYGFHSALQVNNTVEIGNAGRSRTYPYVPQGISHPSGVEVAVTLQLHLVTLNLGEVTGIASPNEYLTFVWLPTMRRPFFWINTLANRDHLGGLIRWDDLPQTALLTRTVEDSEISDEATLRIKQIEEEMDAIHHQIAAKRIGWEIKHLMTHGLPLKTIRTWVGIDAGSEVWARYGYQAEKSLKGGVHVTVFIGGSKTARPKKPRGQTCSEGNDTSSNDATAIQLHALFGGCPAVFRQSAVLSLPLLSTYTTIHFYFYPLSLNYPTSIDDNIPPLAATKTCITHHNVTIHKALFRHSIVSADLADLVGTCSALSLILSTPRTPSRWLRSASVYSSTLADLVYAQLHSHHGAKGDYDVAIGLVGQLWRRQCQCDVLKVSVKLVTEVWKNDRIILENRCSIGFAQYFHALLDLAILKDIFKCIGTEVDLNDLFNSPAAELYSTFYCNICNYVLQHCVKPGSNRTKHDDDQLYECFRLIAREKKFYYLDVDDILVLPMKLFSPVHSHSRRVHGSKGGREEMGETDDREEEEEEEEEEDRGEGEEGD